MFFFRKIYWFFQRGSKGFSNWDASEFCSYIPQVLAGMTRYYHKEFCPDGGVPYPFYEGNYVGDSHESVIYEMYLRFRIAEKYYKSD